MFNRKIRSKRRFVKTVVYRITSTLIKQIAVWIIFREFIFNLAFLGVDVPVSTIWYYCYETLREYRDVIVAKLTWWK